MKRYTSRTAAYSHQSCALAKLVNRSGGALLMEPGTGKTKVAVDFCGRMYVEKRLRRVLVIAPLSVLSVWEKEIEKHLSTGIPRRVIKLTGGMKERVRILRKWFKPPIKLTSSSDGATGYTIIHYRDPITIVLINYEGAWRPEVLSYLHYYNPTCVIVDESHKIKNPTSRQSKSVYTFNEVKYKLILTGTPVTKSPLDIFGQWKFLRPEVFGENWWSFRNKYAVFGGFKNYEIVRFKNLDHIRTKVRQDSYLATKEECFSLPEKTYQDIPVELMPTSRKSYQRLEKEFLLSLKDGVEITAPNVISKMLKLSEITGGFIIDEEKNCHQIGSEKISALRELIENYTYPDRKVVVFARFLWEIQQAMQVCQSMKIKAVKFCGELSALERDRALESFNKDAQVFVCQIASGIGIDLTAASTAIFYSVDYDLGHYIQACDRLHRHGQKEKVTYLHLVAVDTIDEAIFSALEKKLDLAEQIIEFRRKRLG